MQCATVLHCSLQCYRHSATVLQFNAVLQCSVLQCYSSTIQRSAMVGREGTLIIAGDNLIVITIVTVPNHCGYRSIKHQEEEEEEEGGS